MSRHSASWLSKKNPTLLRRHLRRQSQSGDCSGNRVARLEFDREGSSALRCQRSGSVHRGCRRANRSRGSCRRTTACRGGLGRPASPAHPSSCRARGWPEADGAAVVDVAALRPLTRRAEEPDLKSVPPVFGMKLTLVPPISLSPRPPDRVSCISWEFAVSMM